jgi:hypothetical protein
MKEISFRTSTTGGALVDGIQAGTPGLTLADYRLHEPSENRYDPCGGWYRSAS